MSARFVGGELVCMHPAIESTGTAQSLSRKLDGNPKFELSYEFWWFLRKYYGGEYNGTDYQRRGIKIATRKGCYNPVLIDQDTKLFTEEGSAAVRDVITIGGAFVESRVRMPYPPTSDEVTDIDQIIIWGNLKKYDLRILRALWDISGKVRSMNDTTKNVQMGHRHEFDFVEFTNHTSPDAGLEVFLPLASIRNNLHARNSAERLIKFGLIEPFDLPRNNSTGRGRAPVGAKLTINGDRLMAAVINTFDPKALSIATVRAEWDMPDNSDEGGWDHFKGGGPVEQYDNPSAPVVLPAQTAKKSQPVRVQPDPSDIDPETGENLRDLFG